ncbi:hypothetical protein CF15_04470 [Pyrodictium occultum]|uniref:Glycosyltransferase 2-like domain-containing protein n=1 Tax=Pyrodictium occultum TaxID=2309 RepID=A0A0V8RVF1_PYROC|nr:glycosyltransferase [Pyrodictium occultum]KSW12039.1 hypothetical protein CF15_04470 [Pyrodictium occultum]
MTGSVEGSMTAGKGYRLGSAARWQTRLVGIAGGVLWFALGLLLARVIMDRLVEALHLGRGAASPGLPLVVLLYSLIGGVTAAFYASRVFSKLVLARVYKAHPGGRLHPGIPARVSVEIPVFNGEQVIGRVLRALLHQDYPRELMEVIIVDDGSTDGTWSIVSSYARRYPFIRAVRHEVNLGKAEALTTGIRRATGDVIIVLDADTVPERDAVRRLVSRLLYEDGLGAVCGRLIPAGHGGLLYWMQRIEYFLGFELGRFMEDAVSRATLILSGAFSAFRSIVLKPLAERGIPEDTLAEDFDLTVMVWKRGLRTGYEHSAVAYTITPSSLRGLYRQRIRWYAGGLQVLLKHANLLGLRRAGHASYLYGRLLAVYLLGVEYLLPLLHVAGYITLAAIVAVYGLLGLEVLALPLPVFLAAYLAALASTVIMGSLSIIVAYGAEYGAGSAVRIAPYAFIYTLLYIPLLAVAKTDAMIRALLRERITWGAA